MRAVFIVPALAASLISGAASAAHTIVNGSFESTPTPVNGFTVFGNGANIGGWIVTGDTSNAVLSIDTGYQEAGVAFPAQDGRVHLDLTGAGNTGANGVYQDVATVSGRTYEVTFWLGNATGDGTGNSGAYVLSSSLNLAITGAGATNYVNGTVTAGTVNWGQYTRRFTATGATTRLQFTNTTPVGDNFTGLDNVSLAAVPEPASWGLMILGFGLVGGAMRRRSAGAGRSRASLRYV